MLRVSLG